MTSSDLVSHRALAAVSPELGAVLGNAAEAVTFGFGEVLLAAGDRMDRVLLVTAGDVRAVTVDPFGDEVELAGVGPGGLVGAWSGDRQSSVTYRASGPVEAWAVDAAVFAAVATTDPDLEAELAALAGAASVEAALRARGALRDVGPEAMAALVAGARWRDIAARTVLVAEAAPPGPIWFVDAGRLVAFQGSGPRRHDVAFVRNGSWVGVEAWGPGGQARWSVEAVEPCLVVEVAADALDRAREVEPAFDAALMSLAEQAEVGATERADRVPLDFASVASATPTAGGPVAETEPEGDRADAEPTVSTGRFGPVLAGVDGASDDDVPIDLVPPPGRGRWHRFRHVQQVDEMDCGAACLAMVLHAFGAPISLTATRQAVGTRVDGTTMLGLARGAEALGLTARMLKVSRDRVGELPLPAVIHWEGDHWVVLVAVRGGRARIADPASGMRWVDMAELATHWSGFTVLFGWTPAVADLPRSPSALATVWPLFRSHVRSLWIGLALALVAAVLQLSLPLATQRIFDKVLPSGDLEMLDVLVAVMLGMGVLMAVASMLQRRVLARAAVRIDGETLHVLSGRLLSLPLSYFEARRAGDIARRLEGVRQVRQFVVRTGVDAVAAVTQLVAFVGLMAFLSPPLTVAFLTVTPIYVVLVRVASTRLRPQFDALEAAYGRYQSRQIDAIKGIESVKAMGAETSLRSRLVDQFEALVDRLYRAEVTVMAYEAACGFAAFVAVAIFLWFGAREVVQGDLTVGRLVSINTLVLLASGPILTLLASWHQMQVGSVLVGRLDDILAAEPEQGASHDHLRAVPSLSGRVQLRSVGYSHPGPVPTQVLADIDLDVEPGMMVAFVGRSGSGKSTLIKCMTGLIEPTAGEVRYDDVELRELDYRELRRHIGFVLQDPYLFDDTIARNISLGHPDDPARIVEAARLADAHSFVDRLPLGYETRVGESGHRLSGGERQRIAIARALYADPPILILDEATSALDTESERVVQENLSAVMQHRTSFVIAHRLSTVRSADLILVLDAGRVVERGTHDELMAHDGLYRHLVGRQLAP